MKRLKTNGDFITDIKVVLPDDTTVPVKVLKTFFDSEVNLMTATVAAYIDVQNADKTLLPGNHVDVLVKAGENRPLVLIPQSAVMQDNLGLFVYVVNADEKAQKTYVKTGDLIGDRLIVTGGLDAGARIVVQGLQKVENGSVVKQSFVKSEG